MSSNDDRGMAAYVEKRYDDAVELLEAALKDQPGAPDINFYLGISLLMKGKPEESVGPLQTAAANEKSPYQQSAHFFLAKAYLQTADLARAENELQIAASTPGSRASEARSLLERIHALRSTPSSEAF
jgi:tetratricopeptide (TPR) repeat protein